MILAENTNYNSNIEKCVRCLARQFPLVSKYRVGNGLKSRRPVYCAASLNEYYSWPYAKRKANEWLRAVQVKKRLSQMMSGHVGDMWTTKMILMWLRSHGYSPLEYQHMIANRRRNNLSDFKYVDSLTPIAKLLNIFDDDDGKVGGNETDEEFVDVVNDHDQCLNEKTAKHEQMNTNPNTEDSLNCFNSIPIEPETNYIKEQLKIVI